MPLAQKSKALGKSNTVVAKTPTKPTNRAKAAKLKAVKSSSAKAPDLQKAKAALEKESQDASRPKGKSRKIHVEVVPGEAVSALTNKWGLLFKKAQQIESKPYAMTGVFEEKTAITHKVLGWGYILANRNDRLEVLFKDGIKYLISNYKP